ncbi:hypothetical protein GEMRC1_004810 [Eukaryota sp. GEM-RC1]
MALNQSEVEIPETYVGQTSSVIVVLSNDSFNTAHFTFFSQASPEDDEQFYNSLLNSSSTILSPEEAILFRHPNFSISPLQGKLYPKSSVQIMITFSPDHDGHFTTTAHYSLGSSRLPLTFVCCWTWTFCNRCSIVRLSPGSLLVLPNLLYSLLFQCFTHSS